MNQLHDFFLSLNKLIKKKKKATEFQVFKRTKRKIPISTKL